MQIAHDLPLSPSNPIQLNVVGGANRSITNNSSLLINYRNIKPYYMSSGSTHNDIKCTGLGYFLWTSPSGKCILVKCFYSQQAADTIISPSDIVLNHLSKYNSWTQHIMFSGPDIEPLIYPLYAHNGLWYYQINNFMDHCPHAPHEHGLIHRE